MSVATGWSPLLSGDDRARALPARGIVAGASFAIDAAGGLHVSGTGGESGQLPATVCVVAAHGFQFRPAY
jgi:hypothetical protein